MKHAIEYALAAGIGALLRLLPRRVRLAIGRAFGSLVFALDARHRRVTIDNVSQAYGDEKTDEEKRALAEGAFRHFGAMLFELISLGEPSAEEIDGLVEFVGVEHLERARARGKGVIILSGHFGNWEVQGVAHGYRFGPISVLARVQDNPYLNRWLQRMRAVSGNKVVYKKDALSQMRRLLRKGEMVAFLHDQNVHLEDAVFVDFFGRKAATTPVPSWFALRMDAALVPGYCYPLPDGRYRAEYLPPIDVDRYRDMDRNEAIAALSQEMATVQETFIRRHPEFWLWMHRRWRTRPPEESETVAPPATDAQAVENQAAVPELR